MTADIIYPAKFHQRVTSASKPEYSPIVSARRKREILLSVGWSEYVGETITAYTNPDVDNNSPYYLDNAWHEQIRIETARKVFFS